MMRSRQISFTFHLAGLLVAFSHGSVVAKDSADVAVAVKEGEFGWLSSPEGSFDPGARTQKSTSSPHMACDSVAPQRLEGTRYLVHGGAGWHFYDPADEGKKTAVYGLWIEEDVENGSRVVTELAIPIERVPEELLRVGVAGRVVWDPAQRSVEVTIGKQVFEYRFEGLANRPAHASPHPFRTRGPGANRILDLNRRCPPVTGGCPWAFGEESRSGDRTRSSEDRVFQIARRAGSLAAGEPCHRK